MSFRVSSNPENMDGIYIIITVYLSRLNFFGELKYCCLQYCLTF